MIQFKITKHMREWLFYLCDDCSEIKYQHDSLTRTLCDKHAKEVNIK
jgi:hypothetical protein